MGKAYERIVKALSPTLKRARNGVRWVGYGFRRSGHGFQRGGHGLRRGGHGLFGIVTQAGWSDLYTSVVGTALLLGPLWVILMVSQELGLGIAQDTLCSAGQMSLSVPLLITYGLEIVMAFFLLKFLFRTMVGLARAGTMTPPVRSMACSLTAAILPAIASGFLKVGGTSLSACLYP